MNWITTNIRIPEDIYMELKMKAARERKSVAALIREKLTFNPEKRVKKGESLVKQMQVLGKKIAKKNPGINFSQGIIDMRYEQ